MANVAGCDSKICRICQQAIEGEYLGGTGRKPTYAHRACVASKSIAELCGASPVSAPVAVVAPARPRARRIRSRSSLVCRCANCRSGRESLCLVDR